MRLPLRIISSRIRNKIILPYLLLALCLTFATTLIAVRLTVGTLQERIDNRLIEAGQVSSDVLVAVEQQQLAQLRPMVFTEGVAEALQAGNQTELATLLKPYWANANLSTLIAFDHTGQPLLSWQRAAGAKVNTPPQVMPVPDASRWWLVQQIVQGRQDAFGDKFSAFHDQHLYTAAPVRQNSRLVGGLMVGLPLDQLLIQLQNRSQARITTLYDPQGRAVATTQILGSDSVVPAIPVEVLNQLHASSDSLRPQHVQHVALLDGREYQFAYSPLQVRRATNGYFSVAMSRQFIIDTWARQRLPLVLLATMLVGAVVYLGVLISRQITRPLHDLVYTARAVTNGDLQRRATVTTRDELGVLARTLNHMTERLLHLYETSRNFSLYAQTNAILAETNRSVQRLVPNAIALVLLEDHDTTWRYVVPDDAPPDLRALQLVSLLDQALPRALAKHATKPVIATPEAHRLRGLMLPARYGEVCYTALTVQGRLIGVSIFMHKHRGAFAGPLLEPLAAIASMTANALYNTQLYREVQAEGDRLRVILESIADGVLVCDAERNVILMNTTAETLLGVTDWRQQRYHFNQLPLKPIVDVNALHAAQTQIEARYEVNGHVLSASSAVLSSPTPTLAGEVIVLRNISEQVALERAKTQLIAMISHELRTPLTGIQGAVDMLGKGIGGQLSPLQAELAETASRQAQAMSALVDKALMVANIENGTLELNLQSVDVSVVVDAAVRAVSSAGAAAHVRLDVDLSDDLPAIYGDARLLKIALQQVLDNAIKYGGGAPVTISAECHETDVALIVRDQGPGIPADELPYLFQRLQRGGESLNAEPRGMGLGLVITRELVERQAGTIDVDSQLGRGSIFTITLPGVHDAVQTAA